MARILCVSIGRDCVFNIGQFCAEILALAEF